jgi:hypothetical protein
MDAPFLSQICSGLLPMLYRMDKNPDWKVFLNIPPGALSPAEALVWYARALRQEWLVFELQPHPRTVVPVSTLSHRCDACTGGQPFAPFRPRSLGAGATGVHRVWPCVV